VYVLGFNSTHDASAALVRSGEVRRAVEEERLSRRRHHDGFPERAIASVLEEEGIGPEDVSHVAFYWNPYEGLLRFGAHFLKNLPRSLTYLGKQPSLWANFLALPKKVRALGFAKAKFHFVSHHVAHAASAFYPSPFPSAAILSIDGTGEWTTTLMGSGSGNDIETRRTIGYPHSLGKVYEAATQYLGFEPNSGEGKVMGLAAYGKPRHAAAFERMVALNGHGEFRLDTRFFRFQFGEERKWSPEFSSALGPPREPGAPIEARHEDVARSLQDRLETAALHLAHELRRVTGETRLCVAGGVALNSVMNGRMLRDGPFETIWVQPAAHDSGAALGAALVVSRRRDPGFRRARMTTAALGPAFSIDRCAAALRGAALEFSRPEDMADAVATILARRGVVAWFSGRSEYGPRALGHRSLLADPRDGAMRDRLNVRVKGRETFRPFAPAVPIEDAARYFDGAVESPFMLLTFPVAERERENLPAITHVDGTARVQTVRAEEEPRFHALLKAFERHAGVPVLLNTSLNRRGEPIVNTPEEAVALFLSSEIDALALETFLVVKEKPR
jgi:carbamoyltransferase